MTGKALAILAFVLSCVIIAYAAACTLADRLLDHGRAPAEQRATR
jgi:hypothetical protein